MTEQEPVNQEHQSTTKGKKHRRILKWERDCLEQTTRFDDRARITPESMEQLMSTLNMTPRQINQLVTYYGFRPKPKPPVVAKKGKEDPDTLRLLKAMCEDQREMIKYLRDIKSILQRSDQTQLTAAASIMNILNKQLALFEGLAMRKNPVDTDQLVRA